MSTLTGLLGGGGGGSSHLGVVLLTESTTVSFPVDVEALVYVIGAGGGGAASASARSTGGGAGGCAISKLTLSAGTTYTATIGARGTGGTVTSNPGSASNGGNGGNTSFSGSGITTMFGNGGAGGTSTTGFNTLLTGSAGGSASGGTLFNTTGGAAGSITDPSGYGRTSSGGDVGIFATPARAVGNITFYPLDILGYNPLPFEIQFLGKNDVFNEATWSGSTIYYYTDQIKAAGSKGSLIEWDSSNRRRTMSDSGAFSGGTGVSYNDSGSGNNYVISGDASLGGGGGGAAAYYTAYAALGGVGAVIIQILSVG